MPDFAGGLTTPFLAAFDPDGSKTDKLMGKGQGGGGPGTGRGGGHPFQPDPSDPNTCQECGQPPEAHNEGGGGGAGGGGTDWGQAHDDAGVPDSGGYWEYPYAGGPAIWHPASFSGGYQGGPNEATFNPNNGNSFPGAGTQGGGQPGTGTGQ